jgi:N-acetyl-anhydromuramyl-L-alanine amidase AmpD
MGEKNKLLTTVRAYVTQALFGTKPVQHHHGKSGKADMNALGNISAIRVGSWRSLTRALLPALLLLLAACVHHNPLAKWERSSNFNERQPMLIVLHYTAENSAQEALHTLKTTNSTGRVGVQYLIGNDGKIYQMVAENKRAWQAGKGRWGTMTDVNSASIGIEIDNNGHEPFPDVQIDSLIVLLRDLTTRLNIPPTQIIGHEDLAPGRKIDPGPLFPWKRLYDAGFGIWPSADVTAAPPGFDGWLAMAALGYSLDNRANALQSFRHRFRSMESQGEEFDAEDLRILYALTRSLTGQK